MMRLATILAVAAATFAAATPAAAGPRLPAIGKCKIGVGLFPFTVHGANPRRAASVEAWQWCNVPTTTACFSRVSLDRPRSHVANGKTGQALPFRPCRSAVHFTRPLHVAPRAYLFEFRVVTIAPKGIIWLPASLKGTGFSSQECTGLGTEVLNCGYYKHFVL